MIGSKTVTEIHKNSIAQFSLAFFAEDGRTHTVRNVGKEGVTNRQMPFDFDNARGADELTVVQKQHGRT